MSEVKRAVVVGHVKDYGQVDKRTVRFRASTPILDRQESIVRPDGIQTNNFAKNPIFLWGHDGYESCGRGPSIDSVIGKITSWDQNEEYFDVDADFAPAEDSATAEKALRLVRGGYLNSVSIGFYPIDAGYEMIDGNEVFVFRKSELLEVSLVPIPANPEAVAIGRALDQILGLAPPPTSGAAAGAQLREYARGIVQAERVRAFTRSLAQRTR